MSARTVISVLLAVAVAGAVFVSLTTRAGSSRAGSSATVAELATGRPAMYEFSTDS